MNTEREIKTVRESPRTLRFWLEGCMDGFDGAKDQHGGEGVTLARIRQT